MSTYLEKAKSALRQITRAAEGNTYPLGRMSKTFDPIESADSDPTVVKANVAAVVLSVSSSDTKELDSYMLAANAAGRLRKVLVAAMLPDQVSFVPFEPQPNDIFKYDSLYWTVKRAKILKPASVPILYTLFVESGPITAADAAVFDA